MPAAARAAWVAKTNWPTRWIRPAAYSRSTVSSVW